MTSVIDKLIISSPFEEPQSHWAYLRETQQFEKREGRRKSGYWKATAKAASNHDDPGEFVEIDLVNKIRPRVAAWREKGYPNITGITKKLLEYWLSPTARDNRLFWCQLEAIETAIWLSEAPDSEKQGIEIPSVGEWQRQCLKLATGTGKTVVMAMLICWQSLNKIANPKDSRFSKTFSLLLLA